MTESFKKCNKLVGHIIYGEINITEAHTLNKCSYYNLRTSSNIVQDQIFWFVKYSLRGSIISTEANSSHFSWGYQTIFLDWGGTFQSMIYKFLSGLHFEANNVLKTPWSCNIFCPNPENWFHNLKEMT